MTFPSFVSGEVLRAEDMNAVGLWLVKTQTVGTGVPSVSVTGAFSADYDAYKIIWTNGAASNSGPINMTLGASTTGYFNGATYVIYGTGTNGNVANGGTQPFWFYAGAGSVDSGCSLDIDVINPFLARPTQYGGPFMVTDAAGATAGIHKVSTSYTSFNLIAGVGTFTGGTISVYGYKR